MTTMSKQSWQKAGDTACNGNNDQLEQMRRQIGLLRSKLDNEIIVSEGIMRRAMRDKVASVRRNQILVALIAALAIPYVLLMFQHTGMSVWLCAYTVAFMLTALIYTIWTMRGVNPAQLMSGQLVEAASSLTRFRLRSLRWFWIGIPALCVWLPWYAIETMGAMGMVSALVSCGVGLAIGLALGIANYRKTMRSVADVLDQISELTVKNG